MTIIGMATFDWQRILNRVEVPRAAYVVGLAMSTKADPDGTRIFPGIEHLARIVPYEERQIRRGIKWLVDHGLLECTFHGDRHRSQAKVYRLTVDPAILELTTTLAPDEKILISAVHNPVDNLLPEAPLTTGLSDISDVSIGHPGDVYRTCMSAHQPLDQPLPTPDQFPSSSHHRARPIVDGQLPLMAGVQSDRPAAPRRPWREIKRYRRPA